MEDLINAIVQKTGLSRDKAQDAAQTTINWLKDRLPPAVAGQIDSIVIGGKVGEIAGKVESTLRS